MNKEELVRKIKSLADGGVAGEQQNAQELLDKLMKKYNISEEDLQEEKIQFFKIKVPNIFKAESLANQILYSIVGEDNGKGLYGRKRLYYVKCTYAEFLEFEAKYKFYLYHYKKELAIFYSAFIQANNIFYTGPGAKVDTNLTEEDLQMLKMAKGLDKHDYNLQLTAKQV